jgi:hypothetical protein
MSTSFINLLNLSSVNFDDLVTLDSCIALSQLSEPELLEISINVADPKYSINNLCIVSEVNVTFQFFHLFIIDNSI